MNRDRWDGAEEVVVLADALRAAGIAVGTGQVVTYGRALGNVDETDPGARYWAGRVTLVTDHRDLPTYDRVFAEVVARAEAGGGADAGDTANASSSVVRDAASDRAGSGPGDDADGLEAGTVAAARERLRHRRFDRATDEELAQIDAALRRLRVAVPHRTSRRTTPGHRGELDLARTLDRAVTSDGELFDHAWQERRRQPRRLVLLLDVSGSMAGHARAMLRFAIAARATAHRDAGRRVEVFAFGTRLTRLTDVLAARDPDAAIAAAAAEVVDWDGGTRIGDNVALLTRRWGRRGILRGAVVVVCSDGLERGDPAALGAAMARLRRHAHRIVWVNPLAGDPRYEPTQRGMRAALPHVDMFVPGHDLASLEDLADLLADLR